MFDLSRKDTICALATSAAPAAIAVLRVSGNSADDIRAKVFRPRRHRQRAFTVTLGDVVDSRGEVLDEALCTSFPDGKSYTGEASFELSVHGSPLRVRAVLRALVDAGCRLAEPGELTLRAVLTGRMDLCAAEAVDDVVHAKTDAAAKAALRTLRGGLATTLDPVREILVDTLAEIEARLDFPDEDLGEARVLAQAAHLDGALAITAKLLGTQRYGRRLHEGARVVLYGPPNAGKSTLLNALVGEERALVHAEPGTTRDVVEAAFEVGGIAVTLVDVAGVRPLHEAGDVEKLGIARAHTEKQRADVVIALVPANEDGALEKVQAIGGDIAVLTKADLVDVVREGRDALVVSAKTGAGLEVLRAAIARHLEVEHVNDEETVLMRERQVVEVTAAHEAMGFARAAMLEGRAPEVVASELRRAAGALDRLLGKDISSDVLDRIFSKFCIGK